MRRDIAFTFLILWFLPLIGCGSTRDLIIAQVGEKKITLGDLEKASVKMPSFLERGKKELLWTLIYKELMVLEAKSKGLDKDPTVTQRLEELKRKEVFRVFRTRLSKGIDVSEKEMRQYYHKTGLDSRTETRASHIMVGSREEAEEILGLLKAGADFTELARKRSLDEASAQKGGDLGWWQEGVMPGLGARKIFSMEVGQISEPVRLKAGWHIFKVLDRRPIGFKRQRPIIEGRLRHEKLREKERQYMEGLKEEFNLKIDGQTLSLLLEKGKDSTLNLPRLSAEDETRVLFRYDGGEVTLGDYLGWLQDLRPRRRPDPCDSSQVVRFAETTVTESVLLPQALHKAGIDRSKEVRSYLARKKEELMVEELRRQEVEDKLITEEALRKYYQEHLDDYIEPERLTVQATLLDHRADAQELFNQVKEGADMKQVAQNYPLFSQKFKNYGSFSFYATEKTEKRFGRAFVQEATRAKIGELKGPVIVSFRKEGKQYTGYSVFRVLERREAKQKPLTDPKVRRDVVRRLRVKKRRQIEDLFVEFVIQLRVKYSDRITRYEEDLKFFQLKTPKRQQSYLQEKGSTFKTGRSLFNRSINLFS